MTISRRSLMGLTAAAAASSLMPLTEALAKTPLADRRTVAEVLAMRPEDMALASPRIALCRRFLTQAAKELTDASLSRTILSIFENPTPKIAAQKDAPLLAKLKAENLIDAARTSVQPPAGNPKRSPQPFWTAPGSGWKSHHAYPGGLAVHCAVNVLSAQRLCDTYKEATGLVLDRNAAVGGELLHDLHKPWVFAWQKDHTCRKEETLAKTGEHHVLSIAESMKRGVPAKVCVAQACAHEVPGTPAGEALVAGWLRAAAVIAGKDPSEYGVAENGASLVRPIALEGFVVHLADHDFVAAGPSCQWTAAELRTIFREKYGVTAEKDLNALRNYVFANFTAMRLYGCYAVGGKKALEDCVDKLIKL